MSTEPDRQGFMAKSSWMSGSYPCARVRCSRSAALHDASDLQRFPLLHSSDEDWSLWLRPGVTVAWQERGTAFDDSLTVLAGAEQGQGLALTRWSLAAQDLSTGRIVQASERVVPCPRSYYFVCPEMYVTMPKVQQLLVWLREATAAFARPDSIGAVAKT